MASAKFLEEALSTDVDESAVSAIVGSLETQLVTSAPVASTQAIVINQQNHCNSSISNGGVKHGATTTTIANGDSSDRETKANNSTPVNVQVKSGVSEVKLVYPQQTNQTMSGTAGTIIANRVAFPAQTLPNGTIGLSPLSQTNAQTNKQPQLVIKTASGAPTGLVTVPMNVTTAVPQVNNVGSTSSPSQTSSTPTSASSVQSNNVQIVNVRPGTAAVTAQTPQKTLQSRVLLNPQLIGQRPGQAQHITLQSLQGLQPGQQGHLLLKTENGQYQLLRVGPAPTAAQGATPTSAGTTTFRLQTVPTAVSRPTQFAGPPLALPLRKTIVQQQPTVATTQQQQQQQQQAVAAPVASTVAIANAQQQQPQAQAQQQPAARATGDNTKEKCRKFLANLLELSSREPKSVERSVRTLIQELIDMRVEPEDFCDRLERLLNASPQPCLIGFLKKSLPLLRQSLVTKELSIEGIRPPPANVVFSVASSLVQAGQVRPVVTTAQVRLMTPGNTAATMAVRPGQVLQQRLVTPIRTPLGQPTRMVTTTIRQPLVSGTQPPALHPVYPQVVRPAMTGTTVVRQPGIIRATAMPTLQNKPNVPSTIAKPASKEKEKKSFSSAAGFAGDDDINDVAAMGGVNLAEETQRILGSTEFVGTQIRSCKDEIFLLTGPLQARIRQAMARHGLEDPSNEIAAIVSHATQEHLKNLVEKLAVIAEHRVEVVKMDSRYEVTTDIKGQLKFLEELDRAERKRHEEQVRELLLRAAKSRSKSEDPEQAKLKAKAKEMQRIEMEELRQREANATALQAIGPRKKPRMDQDNVANNSQANSANTSGSGGTNSSSRSHQNPRQRMKKVTMRDLLFLLENEKDSCHSSLLYKAYLK